MSMLFVVVNHLVVFGVTRIILIVVPMLLDVGRNLLVQVYGAGVSGSSWVLWMTRGHTPSSRNSGNTRGVPRINVGVDVGCSLQLIQT